MPKTLPDALRDTMDDLREGFRTSMERWLPLPGRPRESVGEMMRREFAAPAIDVEEDGQMIRVTAEMPGMDEKDFSVELQGDKLVIRGQKRMEHDEKRSDYFYSECRYGSFTRTITLPAEVDPERVEATYKHGVLHVNLPKSDQAKAKRLRVNVE